MTAFDLTGKKAFVTGASRGIGRIIAVALAAAGADVALAARSQDGLAETAREVTDLGRKAFVFPLDVTRQDDVTAAIHEAISRKPKGHDFVIDRRHRRPSVGRHMSVTGG